MEKQLMECQSSTIQSTSIVISLQWLIVVIFVLSVLLLFLMFHFCCPSCCPCCTRGSTKKKPQKFQRVAVRKEATDPFKKSLSIAVPQRQPKRQPVTKLNRLLASHEQNIKKQGYSDSANRVQNNSAQYSQAKKQKIQEERDGASKRLQQRLQKRRNSTNIIQTKSKPIVVQKIAVLPAAATNQNKNKQNAQVRKLIQKKCESPARFAAIFRKIDIKHSGKFSKREFITLCTMVLRSLSIKLDNAEMLFEELWQHACAHSGTSTSALNVSQMSAWIFGDPESSTGAAAEENARKEKDARIAAAAAEAQFVFSSASSNEDY
tara:strand:- start:65 stop:1024 length:960 start_codon:yes stop_codon:yes gene_type:complete